MSIKVLWHAYHPSSTDGKSVTGDNAWQMALFSFLQSCDFSFTFGWHEPTLESVLANRYNRFDLGFLIWRWPMPDYPERQLAYENQLKIIEWLSGQRVPFIVYDLDHKITSIDRVFIASKGGRIASPALFPLNGEIHLPLPNPYDRSRRVMFTRSRRLIYIGNNYERYEQARYYLGASNAHLFGNWLIPNPERETPEKVKADFPMCTFHSRVPAEEVISTLMTGWSTIQLAKPSYCKSGFMTIRYAEADAAGVVGFVPAEFRLPGGRTYADLYVTDGDDLLEKAVRVVEDAEYRKKLLNVQQRLVRTVMTPTSWARYLRAVAI